MFEYLNAITALLLVATLFLLRMGGLDFKKIWEQLESLQRVLNFIGNLPKWLDYYNNLDANGQSLQEKKDLLQVRLEDLRECVDEKECRMGRLRKREVIVWLDSAQTKVAEVHSLLEKINEGNNFFYQFVCKAWWGSQVERMIQQVDELYKSGVFEQPLSSIKVETELPTRPLVGTDVDNIARIFEWLDDGTTMIGLHGIEGIGKTEMIKHLYNKLLNRKNLKVYVIQVPENFTKYNLQQYIVSELGSELNDEDELKRAACLHRMLKDRNYVIILDGLGRYFSRDDVGIPQNGKLVVSSRSHDVCRRMGCHPQKTIKINPFPLNDAVELFKRELKFEAPLEPELEDLAMRIVKECGGVPKRIIENAISLRRVEDISVWESRLSDIVNNNA